MNARSKWLAGAALLLPLSVWAAAGKDLRLVDAVRAGEKDAVRSLLDAHADVNAAQADGATPLAWAVYRSDLETADLLIRAGADVNAANDYGITPLTLACSNQNAAMVSRLLAAGADANRAQDTGETPLMTCSRTGTTDGVKALLDAHADVKARDTERSQTALMWAVAEKHPEVTKLLVEHGAEVSARSKLIDLPTPLKAATYSKNVYHPSQKGGFTPLLFAAQSGDLDSARTLAAAGADVNESTGYEGSALLVAAENGNQDVALFLLEKGANPNATDAYGLTPLHWALQEGIIALYGGRSTITDKYWLHPNMPELVHALLARGADPNARMQKDFYPYDVHRFGRALGNNLPQVWLAGVTPFMLAAATGDMPEMRLLVEGRADPKVATVRGASPLMVAAGMGRERETYTEEDRQRYLEAVKLCLALGGDVNATDQDGRTALHGAVFLGFTEMIEFLAAHGANLEAKDKYGQTAMTIALGDPEGLVYRQLPGDAFDYSFRQPGKENKAVVEVLLKLGAKPFTGKYRDRSAE
jgi:uncharacterized protein